MSSGSWTIWSPDTDPIDQHATTPPPLAGRGFSGKGKEGRRPRHNTPVADELFRNGPEITSRLNHRAGIGFAPAGRGFIARGRQPLASRLNHRAGIGFAPAGRGFI